MDEMKNGLWKFTNNDIGYVHYFTSLGKAAAELNLQRTPLEYSFFKGKPWHGYSIEYIDGSDVMWKDIN